MTKFVHIVYVHPVYDGILQTHKVELEMEFDTVRQAEAWIRKYNNTERYFNVELKAVYYGCVNDETGELV
jgi:hypothetical protein